MISIPLPPPNTTPNCTVLPRDSPPRFVEALPCSLFHLFFYCTSVTRVLPPTRSSLQFRLLFVSLVPCGKFACVDRPPYPNSALPFALHRPSDKPLFVCLSLWTLPPFSVVVAVFVVARKRLPAVEMFLLLSFRCLFLLSSECFVTPVLIFSPHRFRHVHSPQMTTPSFFLPEGPRPGRAYTHGCLPVERGPLLLFVL